MTPSKPGKRTYHHGDLRSALIREGLRVLEARNADGLGLRELARAVGVSASSVYRHFPSKDALLQALAAEGLRRLAEAQRGASILAGGGSLGFAATGNAYVAFALDNPALFRLIFSSSAMTGTAEFEPKSDDASALLMQFAASIAGELGPEAAQVVAVQAWALVHGLAVLILDQRLPNDPPLIAKVIRQYVAQLRPRPNNDC
jgi:AcrR family transcriptional regulator